MIDGRQTHISPMLQVQLELEEKAHQVRIAALSDAEFMAGVYEAMQAECDGDAGRPWAEVKKELKIK